MGGGGLGKRGWEERVVGGGSGRGWGEEGGGASGGAGEERVGGGDGEERVVGGAGERRGRGQWEGLGERVGITSSEMKAPS